MCNLTSVISPGFSVSAPALFAGVVGKTLNSQGNAGGSTSLFSQLLAALSDSEENTTSKAPKEKSDNKNLNAQNLIAVTPSPIAVQQAPLGLADLIHLLKSSATPEGTAQSDPSESSEQQRALDEPAVLSMAKTQLDEPAVLGVAKTQLDEPAVLSMAKSQLDEPAVLSMAKSQLDEPAVLSMAKTQLDEPAALSMAKSQLDEPAVLSMAKSQLDEPAVLSMAKSQSGGAGSQPGASRLVGTPGAKVQTPDDSQSTSDPQPLVGQAPTTVSQPAASQLVQTPQLKVTPEQPEHVAQSESADMQPESPVTQPLDLSTAPELSAQATKSAFPVPDQAAGEQPINPPAPASAKPVAAASDGTIKARHKSSSSEDTPKVILHNVAQTAPTPLVEAPQSETNQQSTGDAVSQPGASRLVSTLGHGPGNGFTSAAPSLPIAASNSAAPPANNFAFAMRVTPDTTPKAQPTVENTAISNQAGSTPSETAPQSQRPVVFAATASEPAPKSSVGAQPATPEISTSSVSPTVPNTQQASSTLSKPSEPPASGAGPASVEPKSELPQHEPVRNVQMQLTGDNSQRVNVRMVETGGELRVSVKASDPALAQTLQDHMPELTSRLAQQQYRTDVWTSREPSSAQSNTSNGSNSGNTNNSFNGDASQGRRQNGQQQNQPSWIDELEDNPGPTQISRSNSTWQQ